ncbi:MAG TPA: AbrB/MazE/SpoVT family DNA-binding domain-containing protein [Candidatus Nanoarchaeia archaeon]|nr:AbrB/MazE/SpoVT family DNA-binding domain-containing protein [Candidatus Nanoarchaeia archaeon]
MKRKVIQLAGKTSVVSLPSKWVKKFNINKSDELDIEERGNELVVRAFSHPASKAININADSFSERTLRYCLSSLHKAGYDEISLLFSKPHFYSVVNDMVSNLLLGFVVSEQTKKKMVIKSVANEEHDAFSSALRRCFLVTLSLADSSLDMIKNNKSSELNGLMSLEKNNNQLSSFCLRLINKGVNIDKNSSVFISIIAWNMEKICDEYKYICETLSKSSAKINPEILNIYAKANEFLRGYYNLFYNFSPELLNNLHDMKSEINYLAGSLKTVNSNEMKLVNHIMSIVSKASDMSSSIFALNHDKVMAKFI